MCSCYKHCDTDPGRTPVCSRLRCALLCSDSLGCRDRCCDAMHLLHLPSEHAHWQTECFIRQVGPWTKPWSAPPPARTDVWLTVSRRPSYSPVATLRTKFPAVSGAENPAGLWHCFCILPEALIRLLATNHIHISIDSVSCVDSKSIALAAPRKTMFVNNNGS